MCSGADDTHTRQRYTAEGHCTRPRVRVCVVQQQQCACRQGAVGSWRGVCWWRVVVFVPAAGLRVPRSWHPRLAVAAQLSSSDGTFSRAMITTALAEPAGNEAHYT